MPLDLGLSQPLNFQNIARKHREDKILNLDDAELAYWLEKKRQK